MPIISSAQDVIDTSSPQDLLVEPTIVLTPSIDEPDCHTYTGCGVIVVNKYLHLKPKLHKLKRHRVHREPSCVIEESYVSFVPQCW